MPTADLLDSRKTIARGARKKIGIASQYLASLSGMTFGKILTEHKAHFGRTHKQPPAEFTALWDWAE
jgi:hypothetical protein